MDNMERMVKIPLAYQLVIDDVGWFNGFDNSIVGLPSATGMPRRHVAEDYLVINEIGKAIGQKICCALVLGEWDKDNLLKGMPHATPDPENWDMASEINMDIAEKCLKALESSDFIEHSVHGLMHGYWDENGHTDAEFQYHGVDGKDYMVSPEYFEEHLDVFFKIYKSWGFKKKIRSIVYPSGFWGNYEEACSFAEVLKKNNLFYTANLWHPTQENTVIINGVTYLNKGGVSGIVPWNAYDVDPSVLRSYDQTYNDGILAPENGVIGMHWPNLLRFNPQLNFERVSDWAKFFKRQSEIFGVIVSRDIAFAAAQAVYRRFTKISYEENRVILDFSDVDMCGASIIDEEFCISFRNFVKVDKCTGGILSQYETHDDFKTYKLNRGKEKLVKISFK